MISHLKRVIAYKPEYGIIVKHRVPGSPKPLPGEDDSSHKLLFLFIKYLTNFNTVQIALS